MVDELLELLLAEAPVAAFEAVVADAQRAGAGPEDLAVLRSRTAVALQIRDVLEHRRRREQELAALYATAGDLTSLRDLGAVLQAIVRRARELLSSDTTYLTLLDEARGDVERARRGARLLEVDLDAGHAVVVCEAIRASTLTVEAAAAQPAPWLPCGGGDAGGQPRRHRR